jgi:hypothetical protein
MDPLVIKNLTSTDYTVQSVVISANSSYTVPSGNYVTFAADGYLQTLLFQGIMNILSYGYDFGSGSSQISPAQWLTLVSRGTVVLS